MEGVKLPCVLYAGLLNVLPCPEKDLPLLRFELPYVLAPVAALLSAVDTEAMLREVGREIPFAAEETRLLALADAKELLFAIMACAPLRAAGEVHPLLPPLSANVPPWALFAGSIRDILPVAGSRKWLLIDSLFPCPP